MTPLENWPWPPECELRRLLSEGRGGIVALARDAEARLVALKLLRLAEGVNPDAALLRHEKLRKLSTAPGLLPIHACGLTDDRRWLWESLVLADGVDGKPATATDDGYLPANYRQKVVHSGPLSARESIAVGLAIAEGLATLHAADLVHRDVKPGNLFQVGGGPVLGDYGLISAPGGTLDFAGTEGFLPADGIANQAADLFALGKTLYELWTGCDRLEFPTLPKAILQNAEWREVGAGLNQVLLRACSTRPGQRYRTADAFARDLKLAGSGQLRMTSRRDWLLAGTAAATAFIAGGVLFLGKSQPVIHWRRRRVWDHLPQGWGANQPILDAERNCFYQFQCDSEEQVIHKIELRDFIVTRRDFQLPNVKGWKAILHPVERTLWFAQDGRGPVWRVNPETGEAGQVGGAAPRADTDFDSTPYWNPLTQRLGTFGGYGQFHVHNWRWEFDPASGQWRQIEANDPQRKPGCRCIRNFLPLEGGRRLLMFGGIGNSTGQQGVRDAGFKVWDTHFHHLGDAWILDLVTGRWECALPAPGLEFANEYSYARLPRQNALVVLPAHDLAVAKGKTPEIFVLRSGRANSFVRAESLGDVPDVRTQSFLSVSPDGEALLAFLVDGIYELRLEI